MNEIRFVVSPRIMGEEKFFGPGIAVLLHRVEAYRSIRQATMSMDGFQAQLLKEIAEKAK